MARITFVVYGSPAHTNVSLRTQEKQLLFMREQEETANAHYMVSLAAEYDPVATRVPFKPLDAKYRF